MTELAYLGKRGVRRISCTICGIVAAIPLTARSVQAQRPRRFRLPIAPPNLLILLNGTGFSADN